MSHVFAPRKVMASHVGVKNECLGILKIKQTFIRYLGTVRYIRSVPSYQIVDVISQQ